MGEKKPRTTNVQILARWFIRELKLTALDPEGKPWTARRLHQAHGSRVRTEINDMGPAKLGAIGAQGLSREQAERRRRTSFWDVCDEEVDQELSGRAYERMIASRTVIAAMYDTLRGPEDENRLVRPQATLRRMARYPRRRKRTRLDEESGSASRKAKT